MQPAQLSLLYEQFPAPPQVVLAALPEPDVAEAIRVLAQLVAKAAVEGEADDDE
jgi:hypothetical protein